MQSRLFIGTNGNIKSILRINLAMTQTSSSGNKTIKNTSQQPDSTNYIERCGKLLIIFLKINEMNHFYLFKFRCPNEPGPADNIQNSLVESVENLLLKNVIGFLFCRLLNFDEKRHGHNNIFLINLSFIINEQVQWIEGCYFLVAIIFIVTTGLRPRHFFISGSIIRRSSEIQVSQNWVVLGDSVESEVFKATLKSQVKHSMLNSMLNVCEGSEPNVTFSPKLMASAPKRQKRFSSFVELSIDQI